MDIKSLIHTDALQDKSLWLAIAGPMVIMLSNLFGHPVDANTADLIVASIVAFVVSSKAKQAYVASGVAKNLDAVAEMLKPIEPK